MLASLLSLNGGNAMQLNTLQIIRPSALMGEEVIRT